AVRGGAGRRGPAGVGAGRWGWGAMDSVRLDREGDLLFWGVAFVAARRPDMRRRFAEQLRSFRSGGAEELRRMIESAGISSAVPYERLARIVAALPDRPAPRLNLAPAGRPDHHGGGHKAPAIG